MRTRSAKKRKSSAAGFEPQFGKMIYQLGRSLSPLHYCDLLEKPTKIRLTFTLLKKKRKKGANFQNIALFLLMLVERFPCLILTRTDVYY